MKVILAMITSLDGKTTKWDSRYIYDWTSKEDQSHFFTLISQQSAIIMGRTTYFASQSVIKLSPKILRTVLTSTPAKFQELAVPGQLEFSNANPKDLVKKLEKQGHQQVLLLTGETLSTLFFKEKLIDEIWLTIEPMIFGRGKNMVSIEKIDVALQLQSSEMLNDHGTLLLKYAVL